MAKKLKIAAIVIFSVFLLIIIFQNTETVETKLLFKTVAMSRALLLIIVFIAGFAAGIIGTSYIMRKSKKEGKK